MLAKIVPTPAPLHAGGAAEIAQAAFTASVASHFSARVAPILLLLTLSTLPLSRVHSVSASVAGAQPVLYASSRDSEDRALLEDITESPAAALLALPPGERQRQESLQRLEDERLEQCRAARMFDTCFFFGTAGPTAERATARAGEGRATQPQSQGGGQSGHCRPGEDVRGGGRCGCVWFFLAKRHRIPSTIGLHVHSNYRPLFSPPEIPNLRALQL